MIAGRKLYLGIEGRNADGTEVYPTVWADCGVIQACANADGDPTAEPTPEVWAQFQANMGSLDALETEDRSSLVAAINEACSSGGSVSEEQVEKILADYLQENNITGGRDGEDGVSATHAWNGTVLTVTSASGTSSADLKGEKGEKGDTGAAGADGQTPVRGTDYWTQADQESVIRQVIAVLATPVYGTVDEENNIILSGKLTGGTYTLKYEDPEGNVTVIGVLKTESTVTCVNVLPTAIGYDGAVFNGTGYMDGYRLTGNYGAAGDTCYLSAASGYFATGFFLYTFADCENCVPLYVKGVSLGSLSGNERMSLYSDETSDIYAEAKKLNVSDVGGFSNEELGDQYYKITPNANCHTTEGWEEANPTMARLSLPGSGEGVIITVNQPIV